MNAGPVTLSNYARNASQAKYPSLKVGALSAVYPALGVGPIRDLVSGQSLLPGISTFLWQLQGGMWACEETNSGAWAFQPTTIPAVSAAFTTLCVCGPMGIFGSENGMFDVSATDASNTTNKIGMRPNSSSDCGWLWYSAGSRNDLRATGTWNTGTGINVVVLTYGGGVATAYLNGKMCISAARNAPVGLVNICGTGGGGHGYFAGYTVWNRQLSGVEVGLIHSDPLAFVRPKRTTALYPAMAGGPLLRRRRAA
jgi:hypothetical protein